MTESADRPDYDRLLPNVIREGISKDELLAEYNTWAGAYEQDVTKLGYAAYEHVGNKLCELYPTDTRDRVRILDVGAGSGLLGLKLKEAGFSQVDALDPSKPMLEQAEKRCLYRNYLIEYFTEKPLDITAGTYDVVVGVGVFGYSLVPCNAIHEMVRLTKPGGYVIMSIRESVTTYLEYKDLEPTMQKLEKDGTWKSICRTFYPNFLKDCSGILYVFSAVVIVRSANKMRG